MQGGKARKDKDRDKDRDDVDAQIARARERADEAEAEAEAKEAGPSTLTSRTGHINFFEDLEQVRRASLGFGGFWIGLC